MGARQVGKTTIETVLARDALQLQQVAKPALLRHLFILSAAYPAHVLSYNQMLGQLLDAGNTTTLAHYLSLLESACLVSGPARFSRGEIRRRGSSPKLIFWNNALIGIPRATFFETPPEDFLRDTSPDSGRLPSGHAART